MTDPATTDVIRQLPKVELHLHLETSLRLRRLARRSGEAGRPAAALVADPARFSGYDRLRRIRHLSRAGIPDELYTAENIEAITAELLREAAAHHVRYLEVRVGGRRGFERLGIRPMLEAMARARQRAAAETGVRCGIVVTVVRERGPEEAVRRVREALACRDCGVVGVDLAGDEENFPPALFARAMDVARDGGLGITVHAGEFSGPASVWTAVYQLGAHRIGHGIRAAEDPDLLELLRERQVTLEVCPTSNIALGLCASPSSHPVGRLLAAGVPVTVSSDDPLLLGTDISRELALVASACRLGPEGVAGLILQAARAAFLPPAERAGLVAEIESSLGAALASDARTGLS
ncbi:MAG: adenosine deaminase [Armatimonadota bacterium]|nr:adenosine deaminase [Armatimonadota bacterium]MDR7437662.1 adenosine deaminase [Armatimonadota bacterium]MDR7471666.1 adenosine deaminase [Armatimonadota bacterium]MDR7507951.1 adenosine deaminase [Armatimonadota bacterium]MDR7509810.1 adenosine deaminase [Armatimonadota bacterium]